MGRETTQARESADPMSGLYIHRRTEKRPQGTRTMVTTVDGVEQEWVDADEFMAVQKERDDFRRCMALINAWRWSVAFVDRDCSALDKQLRVAGMDRDQGRAMLSLIESVRAEAAAR